MRIEKLHGLVFVTVAIILMVATAGCSSMGGQSNTPPPNPVGQQTQPGTVATSTPTASSPPASSLAAPRPLFYDFPDIPTPQELDLQSKESYVVQSGSIRTGILTLRGRVDLNSLISFFQMAMPREQWKPKGFFRYQRSVLIFEKSDKTCVIRLYEGTIYTYVEIFVTPASS
jgi:hypothetical protein